MNRYIVIYIFLLVSVVGLCEPSDSVRWSWWPLSIKKDYHGSDTLFYEGHLRAVASSRGGSPYWFHTNMTGCISKEPFSGLLELGIEKPSSNDERWYDYDFGVALGGGVDNKGVSGHIDNLYAHVRLYIADITVGIHYEDDELHRNCLTSGNLLFTRNAHPIPRVSVGIDRYTAFPGLFGYLEVKGGMSYGWAFDDGAVRNWKLHHAFIGGRIGGKLPVRLYYEFHHVAQWGGYSDALGDIGNSFRDYVNVVLVRNGGSTANDQQNAYGNHIGSQRLGLEVDIKGFRGHVYWHNISEDGPIKFIGFTPNSHDGLWGVSLEQHRWEFINCILYEYLNTTDQSGSFHDKDGLYVAGNDSYYQNYIYPNGWTYHGSVIGNAFLQPNNSRVRVHHAGISGDIYGFEYRLIGSFVENYGSYSLTDLSSNRERKSYNTALLLEVNKYVKKAWGMEFGLSLGMDIGTQYGNRFGGMISIKKRGICVGW